MKTLFVSFAFAMLFVSCTKERAITKFEPVVSVVKDDPNFRVSSFNAQQSGGQINVSFSTSLEKDIAEIVLMHGSNTTQFCTVKAVTPNGDGLTTYSAVDIDPQGPTTYYVVKYTTKTGEWGCSELFQSKP